MKKFIYENKVLITLLFICGMLALGFYLYAPYANSLIIDEAIQSKDKTALIKIVLIFAAASILGEIFLSLKEILASYLETQITLGYRRNIHKKVRNLRNINGIHEGELVSYNINDVNLLKQKIRIHIENIINLLQLLIIFIFIGYIDWRFIPVMIFIIPIYGVLPKFLGKKVSTKSYEVQTSLEVISKKLSDSYNLSKEIRLFNKEEWDYKKLDEIFKHITKPVVKLEIYKNLYSLGNIIYFMFLCIILYFSSVSVINGKMSLGTLMALITYFGYVSRPIQGIVYNFGLLKSIEASEVRLRNLYQKKDLSRGSLELDNSKPVDIILRNVHLEKNGNVILENINLEIKHGEFIGIIGPSGGGKSSLLNLLSRLDYPTKGCIELQGHAIEDVKIEEFYKNIKFVSQETNFIEGTVIENLLIDPNIVDKNFLNNLFCRLDLAFLKDNFYYEMEYNGNNFSGGQKQRLALIRALITNPNILILDEATASLDEQTEEKVIELLQELRKNKTTIFVTHNINNLRYANKTFMVDKGKLVDNIAVERIKTYETV
ncbi:ATP-binding cassette domain-containing protein [Priestia aryabhattai]|uniref:ATP-binding cassette domain-containing protein n=1 Tax=Priestia aryabhattai TaxID=412384 RepID=UPI00064EECD9|nr:ABC transporter ATP-binding protein [Priestia aryabhattai]KML31365.1 hypothetical protein VL11_02075 [Priestia aryabhattai]KMN92465.1 hypothetical protein ABV89_27025 [Priestia aryabhattai]MCA1052866.1 ABC transporter ATP-binding protein/permease [Priestia aryabhattai]